MIPKKNTSRPTRGSDNIPLLGIKHNFFQNSYFPSSIKEWNRLDTDIRKLDSSSIFKKCILNFIRPSPNKVSNPHNLQGFKLSTRLRLGLSHLRHHKFKHNSLDTINPLCNYGSDIETTLHFLFFIFSCSSRDKKRTIGEFVNFCVPVSANLCACSNKFDLPITLRFHTNCIN